MRKNVVLLPWFATTRAFGHRYLNLRTMRYQNPFKNNAQSVQLKPPAPRSIHPCVQWSHPLHSMKPHCIVQCHQFDKETTGWISVLDWTLKLLLTVWTIEANIPLTVVLFFLFEVFQFEGSFVVVVQRWKGEIGTIVYLISIAMVVFCPKASIISNSGHDLGRSRSSRQPNWYFRWMYFL
jgi:hypothetical protein